MRRANECRPPGTGRRGGRPLADAASTSPPAPIPASYICPRDFAWWPIWHAGLCKPSRCMWQGRCSHRTWCTARGDPSCPTPPFAFRPPTASRPSEEEAVSAPARGTPELHHFTFAGRPFVLDVRSSAIFELGESGPSGTVVGSSVDSPIGPLSTEAHQAWKSLRSQGFFPPDPPPAAQPNFVHQTVSMEISATHRCTLRCRYCYSAHDAELRKTPLDMPREVMDAALEWGVHEFAKEADLLYITTGCTGESLLTTEAYEYLRDRAGRLGQETGKCITCRLGSTNLTLASDPEKWTWLVHPDYLIPGVSFDGPRPIQDGMRPFPDGRGSYDEIVATIARLHEVRPLPAVQAVITGLHPRITEIYLHLYELGFRTIDLRPVRGRPEEPHAINAHTIEAVKQGHTDFVEFLLAQEEGRLLELLLPIWGTYHHFGRVLLAVLRRSRFSGRCEAGREDVCVDTNGDIYPCPSMVGLEELRLGSVFTGVSEAARRVYYEGPPGGPSGDL